MDSKSHQLFAKCLLEHVEDKITSPEWGTAPDIDMKFLHRWYRHRISVLPKIYNEFINGFIPSSKLFGFEDNKDNITLCILSHLYLDIFNGWIFPFGLWNPIYPKDTIINDVLDDIDEPSKLVKNLKNLSGLTTFSDMFYIESEGIFKEFIKNLNVKNNYELTEILVKRLSIHLTNNSYIINIELKAIKDIHHFTKNNIYNTLYPYEEQMKDCEQFEIEYADLINKTSGV